MNRLILGMTSSLLLVGCARFSAVTEVAPDGTWTRESRFTSSTDSPEVSESFELEIRDELSKYFGLAEHEGWQRDAGTELDEGYLKLRREAKAGEELSELEVLSKSGEPLVRNRVTVRRLGDDRLEYRETLNWIGERPAQAQKPSAAVVERVESLLPEDLEDRAAVSKALAKSLAQHYFRLLFGGSGQEPLLAQAMVHREIALRRLEARMETAVLEDLRGELPKHPQAERFPRLVEEIVDERTLGTLADDEDDDEPNDDRLLIGLSFTVRMPGRIVETNGEWDEVTGEVYWTLFAGSAAVEDVVLRAVCEVE